MKTTRGFTFVEMIVVVTIFVLMSSSWFFYFANYLWQKKIDTLWQQISLEIQDLDTQIIRKQISDYTVYFSLDFGYWYQVNNTGEASAYILSSDFSTGSFIVWNTHSGAALPWTLKLYQWEKIHEQLLLPSDTPTTLELFSDDSYSLASYFSGSLTNSIGIKYFSEENLWTEEDTKLYLSQINSLADMTGTGYTQLKVENTGNGKKFTASWDTLESVYLEFTQWGYTYVLPLIR